jgi:hypothetical protein
MLHHVWRVVVAFSVHWPSDVIRAELIDLGFLAVVTVVSIPLPSNCYDKLLLTATMPPSKKRKTSEQSSAPTQEKEPESDTPHKHAGKGRDVRFFHP